MLAERQGTAIWAAKLSDPELIDRLEEEMRTHGRLSLSDMRPPLLGFDQYAAGLLMLTNQVISLRMEQGNVKLKHLEGPKFPTEIVDERLRKFATTKRNTAIDRAQQRWAQKHSPVVSNA